MDKQKVDLLKPENFPAPIVRVTDSGASVCGSLGECPTVKNAEPCPRLKFVAHQKDTGVYVVSLKTGFIHFAFYDPTVPTLAPPSYLIGRQVFDFSPPESAAENLALADFAVKQKRPRAGLHLYRDPYFGELWSGPLKITPLCGRRCGTPVFAARTNLTEYRNEKGERFVDNLEKYKPK